MKGNIFKQLVLIGLVFISSNVFSQFEQKITLFGSGSFIYPDMVEEYSSYGNGLGIDGGIQFNLNKTFSLYGSVRFYYMFGSSEYDDAYYDNLAFGGGAKINLLPTKRINPYFFAEANINSIWLEEYLWVSDYYDSDFGISIGGLGGLGFDFNLNDNFGIFVQSGVYYTLWDARINLYSQFGFRVNMLKSKTI